ncbi:Tol-Pal system beta propeller repeat protein TolB [Hyphomonas sp. FCG-A18]|jgi:TolB protein|uniref:Tol-Pal system beta propeller repeat protein TolB n=1 Tax=Hyphomonas sp. FCG-A18 TaxID=3080019 RepID=UPI002B2FC4C0|nr:Tol-Pal system beta propeller repeat protein TolB [Hyphomonas sp. FCG-A18]
MFKRLLSALALGLSVLMPTAMAQLEVNIGSGNFQPTPIAIPDFEAVGVDPEIARQISEVVRNDLESTGLFVVTPESAHIQKDLDIEVAPRFADWKIIKTDALAIGTVEQITRDGTVFLRGSVRLWDVFGEELMRLDGQPGKRFRTEPQDWRRIAHKISDAIYTRLTGESGYFDTRIVYIAETGPKNQRVKRLAIMDADGANNQYLTSGRFTVLTPRFSPEAQQITYMSYEGGMPRVYLYDLKRGRQEVLGNFTSMTFAPRFSRDGRSVLLTQAENGNSEVYIMDLVTRQTRRLTNHPAIDTSPSMSPDGQQIVFNSDRGGSPQLYIMNTDGSPRSCPSGGRDVACRITFGQGRYSTPVWSPRGDLIAFTKQTRGKFHIGVIGIDGDGERLLTESYLDEGPDWSPNGRVITFFRESGPGVPPKLMSVDLTGRNLRNLPTPTDASDPAWSPLLQ